MAIFYKDNPRKFDKETLVLVAYTHVVAFKRMFDTIMIAADCHLEIKSIFDEQMKFLKRKNPLIVWYLPKTGTPIFYKAILDG